MEVIMGISDVVSNAILRMLEESNGIAEIKRNELAELMGCVPSQINYVLTSRFTPEQGYIIESRRGGGGFVRITRVKFDRDTTLMHGVNSIGDSVDCQSSRAIVSNLVLINIISPKIGSLILSAISENSFRDIPIQFRDKARATILKQMLLTII
jgi:transcriptional regulator of stress and heat shock response